MSFLNSKYNTAQEFCQLHNDKNLKTNLHDLFTIYHDYVNQKIDYNDYTNKTDELHNSKYFLKHIGKYFEKFSLEHSDEMIRTYTDPGMYDMYMELIINSPKDHMCLHHNRLEDWRKENFMLNDPNQIQAESIQINEPILPQDFTNNITAINDTTINLIPSSLIISNMTNIMTNDMTSSSLQTTTLSTELISHNDTMIQNRTVPGLGTKSGIDTLTGRLKCPRFPDDLYCWPVAYAGETVNLPCINFNNVRDNLVSTIQNYDHDSRVTAERSATKHCNIYGQWENTDDSLCRAYDPNIIGHSISESEQLFSNLISWSNNIHYVLGSISLISCLVSLFIYQYFKNLQCTRVTIHTHLIISYILYHSVLIFNTSNVTFLSSMQPTISYSRDPTICDVSALFHVPGFWICKIAKLLYWYAELANTAWMFCEALFLRYQILANVFSDLNLLQFYLIGWIAPIGLALPLFVLTYIDNNNFKMKAMDELLNGTITIVEYQMTMPQTICMSQTSNSYSTYFLTGPIICCLFLNMIILITIIKTVVSKLRASTDKFTMKALKATCLLMPLLGAVQFIAIYNPFFEKKNTADGLWHILNITIKSSLGTLVCVCYCFTNSEVQRTLKRQYGAKMENIKPSKSVYSNFSRSCTERSTQNTEAESISMIDNSNNQNGSNNTRSPSKFSQMQSGSVYSNRLGKNGSYHNSSVTSSGGYKGPNIGNPKKLFFLGGLKN